jgi:hypothetical protein
MAIIKDSYTALIFEKSFKAIGGKLLRTSSPQIESSMIGSISQEKQHTVMLKASISSVCIGEALILGCYFA